jgi:hypothetical protein
MPNGTYGGVRGELNLPYSIEEDGGAVLISRQLICIFIDICYNIRTTFKIIRLKGDVRCQDM